MIVASVSQAMPPKTVRAALAISMRACQTTDSISRVEASINTAS